MASFTWPASLPQDCLSAGFTETVSINTVRTPMDSGPAKIRRRSNKPTLLYVSFVMSDQQVATLQTFVTETLLGVRRFNWVHPRTDANIEVRFVADDSGQYFTSSRISSTHHQVSMTFEVLP